jgi:hypothetical protein
MVQERKRPGFKSDLPFLAAQAFAAAPSGLLPPYAYRPSFPNEALAASSRSAGSPFEIPGLSLDLA